MDRHVGSGGLATARRSQDSCGVTAETGGSGSRSGSDGSIAPRIAMIVATACLQLNPTKQSQLAVMWVPPARVSRTSTVVKYTWAPDPRTCAVAVSPAGSMARTETRPAWAYALPRENEPASKARRSSVSVRERIVGVTLRG